jgi:hypothetical protein
LGYIFNDTKRFFTYVPNRVERIRRCSEPKQWNYVPSKLNPADEATRSLSAKDISQSSFVLKDFTKHLRIEMLQSNLYHEENRSYLLDPSFNSVSNSVLHVLASESGSMRGKSSSSYRSLDPYMDNDGLIRVGGRLRKSDLTLQEKHPLIIPKKHHIAYLLIKSFKSC